MEDITSAEYLQGERLLLPCVECISSMVGRAKEGHKTPPALPQLVHRRIRHYLHPYAALAWQPAPPIGP